MNRIWSLSVYGVIALLSAVLSVPVSQAQVAAPLQAQKAISATNLTPAPAKTSDASIVLGGIKTANSQPPVQYLLVTPCEGWNTVLINLSGCNAKPPANLSINAAPNLNYLSNLIDQDLLKEYGCQLEARRILARGQRKITIDAYQFATPDGAYGAYCTAHRGSTSYAVQGDASSEDQESFSFCKDRYFVCLQASEQDDDEAKSMINSLVKRIIDHIDSTIKAKQSNSDQSSGNRYLPYNTKPAIFNSMPTLGRVLGSEKLIMGPVSLKRFFPAPYATDLMPLQKGAVADYRIEGSHRDRLKLLIASYPTAQEANMIYAKYTSTLSGENNEKTMEGFTFPSTLFKIADRFLVCQLRDKQVIIINGARHKDTAEDLAHQIYF